MTLSTGSDRALHPSRTHFAELGHVLALIESSAYPEAVDAAAAMLVEAARSGGKILVFGNGGSAADAQHIAAEWVGRFRRSRRPLPAIALTADTAALTCIANDFGYEEVFARQIEALARPGDVAWGISTSGRSESVIRGLRAARRAGAATLLLTGAEPGAAGGLADLVLAVPSSVTARIQEAHTVSLHALCATVEDALFEGSESAAETPTPRGRNSR